MTNLLFSGGAFGGSEPPSDGYNYDKDLLPADAERAAAGRVTAAVDDLLVALGESGATLVAVTNAVGPEDAATVAAADEAAADGLGVVPEYPLARLYRDQLGRANQRLARAAGRVCFLVSGYPLDVKALAAPFPAAPPFPPKESDQ